MSSARHGKKIAFSRWSGLDARALCLPTQKPPLPLASPAAASGGRGMGRHGEVTVPGESCRSGADPGGRGELEIRRGSRRSVGGWSWGSRGSRSGVVPGGPIARRRVEFNNDVWAQLVGHCPVLPQDDAKYRSTIRRHVDLETVRSKLEAGGGGGGACYGSASEFYRDLLLLCANALVFFPRGSPEDAAAARTRTLVSKHMAASLRKDQPGASASGKAAAPASKKAKAEADVGSLLEKTAPIIVCRKRSSIAKAAAAVAKDEKADKAETDREEESEVVRKKKPGGAKDKARGPRTNKTRAAPARKASQNQKAEDNGGSDSDAPAETTKKPDKKGGGGGGAGGAVGSGAGVAKKRNAVNFLNRMKQGSAPSTERVSLLETLKLSAAAEQKKAGKGSEGKRESAGGSGSKRGAGTPPGRRNVGRPPKRAAAPPSPPPAKRGRGGGGKRGGRK